MRACETFINNRGNAMKANGSYPGTCHRWNWVRKEQWWPGYRDRMLASKSGSCGAVLKVLGDPTGKLVLDATCGLGRKTLILHQLDMRVVGSDANAYAVEKARELAASERCEIEFYVSEWRVLPNRIPHRFDAVFVDAFLDCCETRQELETSLAGVADVLKSGGVFINIGPEPNEKMADVLDRAWKACDRFYVEWQFVKEDCECTCVHVRDKGADFIDDHHLYVIKEKDVNMRMETATIRQWFRWDRKCLDDIARSVGFTDIHTETFEGYGFGGTTFTRIVARK